MLLLFTTLGGIGFAGGSTSASQYQYGHGQYGKKVTICHKGKTITVSVNAWPAHRAHGDHEGACAQVRAAEAAQAGNAAAHAQGVAAGKGHKK